MIMLIIRNLTKKMLNKEPENVQIRYKWKPC